MKSSHKKAEKRSVFDVHAAQENRNSFRGLVRRMFHADNVINLRKKFHTRYPLIWGIAFFAAIAVIFFGIRSLSTRAEVQDLNPSTCLGTWVNPANAEGVPETMASSGVLFSASNSAMYATGTQIFCGGFLPQNLATSGVITNVGLTLVWQVGSTSISNASASTPTSSADTSALAPTSSTASSTSASTDTNTNVSATSSASTTEINTTTTTATDTSSSDSADSSTVATTTESQPVPPPAPVASSSPTSNTSTTTSLGPLHAFFAELVPFALADDTGSTTVSTTVPDESSTVIAPPIFASLEPVTSSASSTTLSTSTPVVLPPPVPDNNFLDVSYSTDGETWISIGKVNTTNWQNFTITLPVSNWNDLQSLQIRIEGIPTTQDPIPPVYLDGMYVEVHYDIPPAILLLQNETSSAAQVVRVNPNVTITNPAIVPPPTVPAPTITAIDEASDTVSVTVQYVGDFYTSNPLYLFVYPDGTSANRNDADSAFTFAGTPQDGPSINAVSIDQNDFDPVTKQATVTIVAPVTPDDSEIATGDMIPGTYDVDISYFDSVTWHLIRAQTFTWP